MATDPSTEREEAAEDAADLWTRQQGYAMTGTEWGAFAQGHLAGSAWARTHFAAQEPTDAEVEAVKAVLDSVEYADEPQSIRAALSAARAARRDEEQP